LIAIFLIFKPWQIDIKPSGEAIAEENLLAVMYFENIDEPDDSRKLGDIATNLLITDLSESQYVRVLSSQRLLDLVRQLGGNEESVDAEIATKVAQKARAKWMLTGGIISHPQLIITAQIIETSTGRIVSSQKVEGDVGDNIFTLIDKLTLEIKKDLSLPSESFNESDRMIADKTTHSTEAYRFYLEGIGYYNQYYFDEAKESLQSALRYDSTMAMVYYYLSHLYQFAENLEMISKAKEFSHKVNLKEMYLINAQEARLNGNINLAVAILEEFIQKYPEEKYPYYMLGSIMAQLFKFDKSIEYLKKAIELDPLYKLAQNQLAYSYANADQKDKAIAAANKYIKLSPDEANPYDSRGDIFLTFNMLDEAMESYKHALERKSDFSSSILKLAQLYHYRGDYVNAEKYYNLDANKLKASAPLKKRLYQAYLLLSQGKVREVLGLLDEGILLAQKLAEYRWEDGLGGEMQWLKFKTLSYFKQPAELLPEFEEISEIKNDYFSSHYFANISLYVELLSRNNDFLKAEQAIDKLKKLIDNRNMDQFTYIKLYCQGIIEFEKSNFNQSTLLFKEAVESANFPCYKMRFMLARSYYYNNKIEEAVFAYDTLITDFRVWDSRWGYLTAKARYNLAIIYEEMGEFDKAEKLYGDFLDIWESADQNIVEIQDARERLNKLRAGRS
jgi:tetratricopeptide (TPR) repeat protein